MEIDLVNLVEDVLRDTHSRVKGKNPKRGGYRPNEKTCSMLRTMFPNTHEMVDFLKDSMYAHIYRTELTGTPFFVNSHLLAESSIEYMEKYRDQLHELYGDSNGQQVFASEVSAKLLADEQDFVDVHWTYTMKKGHLPPSLIGIRSKCPLWIVLSVELGRFDAPPEEWNKGTGWSHDKRKMKNSDLYAYEKQELRRDGLRFELCKGLFHNVLYAAAMTFIIRYPQACIPYYDEGTAKFRHDSPIQEKDVAVDSFTSLKDRDYKVPMLVRSKLPAAFLVDNRPKLEVEEPAMQRIIDSRVMRSLAITDDI